MVDHVELQLYIPVVDLEVLTHQRVDLARVSLLKQTNNVLILLEVQEVVQDVRMTVHVMDMDTKNYGKSFILFPFILLLFFTCKKSNIDSSQSDGPLKISENTTVVKDSSNVTINVLFIDKGVFTLNSLINQRNNTFEIKGTKNNESLHKTTVITKPTVFEKYRMVNGKPLVQRYFAFGNDTLNFKFRKDSTIYTGNKKNNILNSLIHDNNIFSIDEPTNLVEHINDLNKNYIYNVNKIKQNEYKYDNQQSTAITTYLKVYFYNKIFNINFSKIHSPEEISKLDDYYKDVVSNIKILDQINTVLNKRLVFNLLRYVSFKKNNPNLLENLSFLDENILKSEALDGFLLDYLELEPKLTKKDIAIIKKYVRNTQSINEVEKIEKISNDLLNVKVQSFNAQDTTLKNVFSVKNENFILIDLWATWCIPCLKENPAWKKAEEKYSSKIKFVRISIDNDKLKWNNFLKKNNENEFNYLIDNHSHPFIQKFKINSIPRFILLNKNYEVISDDFVRPSDSNFNSEIEKLL